MDRMDLVDRLAAHRTLGTAPREQLAWLVQHGELWQRAAGVMVRPRAQVVEHLWVVLSGRLAIRVNQSGGLRRELEWREGDVSGILPYSRLVKSPGDVTTEEPTEILVVHSSHFPEMIRECHEVTAILVHVMVDRARYFTSSDAQNEKMLSLGRLAAGLAHELNNPASAVVRTAGNLAAGLQETERAFQALGQAGLSEAQLAVLARARTSCSASGVTIVRSAIEQAEREDEIASWLETHRVDVGVAEALAESVTDFAKLEEIAGQVDPRHLEIALRAHAAACAARKLASEIEAASTRIHGLVAAVKGFTYMDQTSAPKPVDVGQGLSDTLTVLRGKAHRRSAGIALHVAPDLPRIHGFGGELNQVWLNLIDNALDAIPDGGHVDVIAEPCGDAIVVRVIDNGPGIPQDVRGRMFEPFFTTKPVGEGTGLGLDIVRRLVSRHEGEISVSSRPGNTELRVTLPIASRATASPPAQTP